jgi:extradiol dioxygenase family protein
MTKLTTFKVYVLDQQDARKFYANQLGFKVAEDKRLGDYRWLLVQPSDTQEVTINLEIARTDEEKALVGRQAASQPLFGLATDDCQRDYSDLKERGVKFEGEPEVQPWGTAVMLEDLYGNKIYPSQEPA